MRQRTVLSRLVLASVTLAAGAVALPCWADPPTDDLKEACATSYEQGQTLRRAGNLSWAQAQLAICQRTCPDVLVHDCRKWSLEIDRELPSLIIEARDRHGHRLDGVSLSIDDADVAMPARGKPLKLDAGAHRLVLTKDGEQQSLRIELKPRERGRVAMIRFSRALAALPPRPREQSSRGIEPPTAAWIIGGIGVLGLTTGAVLGVKGQLDRRELRSSCAPNCAESDVDAIDRDWTIAGIAAGVGAVAVGVAIAITLDTDGPRVSARIGGRE